MKVLVIPAVREIYNNQFEYCVDIRLLNFIKKVFNNVSIEIFNSSINSKYDLIIFSGGNNSISKNKADKIRNKYNNYVYKFALKHKIKIFGICHGAHFLSKKFGFKIKKRKGHIGFHKVTFKINKIIINKIVNSYHNETINFENKKNVDVFCFAKDKTIEAFHVKNKKILGIMWHPERYNTIKVFDKKLIKKFYATNSIIGG